MHTHPPIFGLNHFMRELLNRANLPLPSGGSTLKQGVHLRPQFFGFAPLVSHAAAKHCHYE